MRASERAYTNLLDDIQSGALAPGTVVGEVEQATRLGVSRTPLREAIARLAADGLVVQQSARVTIVAPMDPRRIDALFETRRALEEMAARLAAARRDAGVFHALAADFAAVSLTSATGREAYYALIGRFDVAVDEAVDNEFLIAALRTIRAHLGRVRRMAQDNPDRLAASVGEHRVIAEAIAAGDGDLAAHATHVHLANALRSIRIAIAEPHDHTSAYETQTQTGAA